MVAGHLHCFYIQPLFWSQQAFPQINHLSPPLGRLFTKSSCPVGWSLLLQPVNWLLLGNLYKFNHYFSAYPSIWHSISSHPWRTSCWQDHIQLGSYSLHSQEKLMPLWWAHSCDQLEEASQSCCRLGKGRLSCLCSGARHVRNEEYNAKQGSTNKHKVSGKIEIEDKVSGCWIGWNSEAPSRTQGSIITTHRGEKCIQVSPKDSPITSSQTEAKSSHQNMWRQLVG